ncbi:uncharacterized protein LOC120681079 [Panicum virgatum]|uniref:uncharacterized protein LOC120681079 n=1 Tax=Panicum virgatum TaxID=38727 RepID=UPI0019D60663|nr:uncharacterized protein LOC120681079 [Panicum virgatum]
MWAQQNKSQPIDGGDLRHPLAISTTATLAPSPQPQPQPPAAAALFSGDPPLPRPASAETPERTLTCHYGALERHRPAEPAGGAGEAQAQEEAPRAVPQLFLHGCQVPGLLQHHYRVQPLPDGGGLPWLPDGALPADRREGQANRGVLLPPQGRLNLCDAKALLMELLVPRM